MYHYSILQWLFFFYFYCFFGWCFESTYVSLKQRPLRFINRGFMRGPYLPLYGTGAIMMLLVSAPFSDHIILTYLAGCIGATALEYVTGVTMEALFKVRYWDYSQQPFNFQGQICLTSTLAWGFLTVLMNQVVHKPVEQLMYHIPPVIFHILVPVLTILIFLDFMVSFKTAMDIRDILIKMEAFRDEMQRMQRRLDVIVAIAEDDRKQFKKNLEIRFEERAAELESRLEKIYEKMQNEYEEHLEQHQVELSDIRERINTMKETSLGWVKRSRFLKRSMILGNPTMYSKAFKEHFEELKQQIEKNRK